MTDNEIIKALECCFFASTCKECPFFEKFGGNEGCPNMERLALDLINRQKAEIAELQSELIITKNNFDNAKDRYDEAVKIGQKMNEKLINSYKKLQTAKAEARKEFAERLKDKGTSPANLEIVFVSSSDIDNLLAEMESERK